MVSDSEKGRARLVEVLLSFAGGAILLAASPSSPLLSQSPYLGPITCFKVIIIVLKARNAKQHHILFQLQRKTRGVVCIETRMFCEVVCISKT